VVFFRRNQWSFSAGLLTQWDNLESACSQRINKLAVQAAQLRDQRAGLATALEDADQSPRPEQLGQLRQQVAQAIACGDTRAQKHLLQILVHEIRSAGRDSIKPTFKIPTNGPTANPKVRKQNGSVPPARLERATHGLGNRRSIL
jgi:preprotein translocase subunit SecD